MAKETDKQDIMNAQMIQQQMQTIMIQKENTRMQLLEIENALKEIKTATGDVFKTSGILLIKSEKGDITKELEEKKGDLDIRMKSLEKKEESMKTQILESQKNK